jgi:molecular chaperone GrpE
MITQGECPLVKEIEVVVEESPDESAEVKDLGKELSTAECTEYIDHLQRMKAEFDNYRKRVERERAELEARAKGDLCKQLLPIIDDLERALAHADNNPKGLSAGLELVYKNLRLLLEREGVTRVHAVGERFDPHIHEAVMVESKPSGRGETVTEEIQRGYMHKGRLLRPAKVKVSS